MAMVERVFFQPYTMGKRGRMVPGQPVLCRNAGDASLRAEKSMAGGRIVGGHVVRIMADEEAGDYGEPVFLLSVGAVPEEQ